MAEPKDNIVLIGMPAVGKSTVGVLLAKQIGYAFIDTDLRIQSGEKKYLQQIIAESGIEAFCDLEARYVQQVSARRSIIATGGSVVYRPKAMAHLQTLGQIVLLDIGLAYLKNRLGNLDTRGVVRPPGQSIDKLFAERQPLYQQFAQTTVDCSNRSPQEVVLAVAAAATITAP